jgi:hypothetical protein
VWVQAALAYDLAAIKCRGEDAQTNFPMAKYAQELRHVNEARFKPSFVVSFVLLNCYVRGASSISAAST